MTLNPGDKFNMLTVVRQSERKCSDRHLWECRCDCGNISYVLPANLRRGTTKSCGCLFGKKRISIGQRFGRLVVLERLPARTGKTIYLCRCDCGNTSEHRSGNLNNGLSTSCGCYKLEQVSKAKRVHGHGHPDRPSPTYISWLAMRGRCRNQSDPKWARWGGRGITICDRWNDFANFLADMGERPKGKTLDRYPDNDGPYEPGNCRWATPKEQASNRRLPKRQSPLLPTTR